MSKSTWLLGLRFAAALLPRLFGKNPTTREPPVGFELEINGFQFYAIANLDKTYIIMMNQYFLPTSRKVLPTFQTFCPVGVKIAQTVVHFAHFQVQAWKWGVLEWASGRGMSLRKVSYEAFVFSVFSRNQEKTKPLTWRSVSSEALQSL